MKLIKSILTVMTLAPCSVLSQLVVLATPMHQAPRLGPHEN